MRDVLENALGWAVVLGIVLGVILGRKRGREQRAASIAAAVASARQDWQAELNSLASASVVNNIALDASRRQGDDGRTQLPALPHNWFEACTLADPWDCPVCAPALRAGIGSRELTTADHRAVAYYYDDTRHDHDNDRRRDDNHGVGANGIPVARPRPRQDDGRNLDGLDSARVLRARTPQTGT